MTRTPPIACLCLARVVAIVLALASGLAHAPEASAAPPWEIMGGPQQVVAANIPTGVNMTVVAGTTPTTVWQETSNEIRSARWNGTAWAALGGKVNGTGAGADPDIANDGADPWVVYTEVVSGTPRVFVEEYVSGAWTARGAALNINTAVAASEPHIAFDGTTPYVSWTENGLLMVKRWNGSAWSASLTNTTTSLRVVGGYLRGDLAVVGGQPWVVLQEADVAGHQIRVYAYSGAGTTWNQRGTGMVNTTGAISNAGTIATDGTNAWISWHEWTGSFDQIRVKAWSGTTWNQLGAGFINANGNNAQIGVSGSTVYVAHNEVARTTTASVLSRWNGSAWTQVGGLGYAVDGDNDTGNTDLGFIGTTPVVAFLEIVSGSARVYARRYVGTNAMARDITNVDAVASSGQVALTWTNPGGGTHAGVRIYRSTVEGTLGTLVQTTAAAAVNWTDTGRTNGTPLFYTLVAFSSAGDARESAYDTADSFQATPRAGSGVASDGSVAWAFGGMGTSLLGDVWRYDPASDLISNLAPWALPAPRVGAAAVYAPNVGRAYLFGGNLAASTTTNVVRFDTTLGTTSVVAALPGARAFSSAVYLPSTGRIYVFGGEDFAGTTTSNAIYEFDPVTETIATVGVTLPVGMSRSVATSWPDNGCAYVAGGITGAGVRQASVLRFCPARGGFAATIAAAGVLPVALAQPAAYATGNEIVIAGGSTGSAVKTVYSFLPQLNRVVRHELTLPNRTVAVSPPMAVGAESRGLLFAQAPLTPKVTQVNAAPVRYATPSAPPNTPTNATPATDGYANPLTPTLTASAFSDPDGGAVHGASQWQVRTNAGTYVSPLFDSGEEASQLTSVALRGVAIGDGLYWFRVRYADAGMAWSGWSTETRFRVDATAPVAAPSTPADGASTSTTPTLSATYTDSGPSPTGTVQFELCSDAACATVVQSNTSVATLPGATASWSPTVLTNGSTYRWRVRAADHGGNVGAWSTIRSFTVAQVTVSGVTPATVARGRQALPMRVNGTNFVNGATVVVSGANVTVSGVTWVSATRIDFVLDVASAATTGVRNVTVTNPDLNTGSAVGALTVTNPTITVTTSTVGWGDASRQLSPSPTPVPTINFGALAPGVTREIGTAGSGQVRTGEAAVELGVSSDVDYVTNGSVAAWSGPAALAVGALKFQPHGGSSWTDTTTAPFAMRGLTVPEAPSTSTWGYDLQLVVPPGQTAGTYTTTLTITVTPGV